MDTLCDLLYRKRTWRTRGLIFLPIGSNIVLALGTANRLLSVVAAPRFIIFVSMLPENGTSEVLVPTAQTDPLKKLFAFVISSHFV